MLYSFVMVKVFGNAIAISIILCDIAEYKNVPDTRKSNPAAGLAHLIFAMFLQIAEGLFCNGEYVWRMMLFAPKSFEHIHLVEPQVLSNTDVRVWRTRARDCVCGNRKLDENSVSRSFLHTRLGHFDLVQTDVLSDTPVM